MRNPKEELIIVKKGRFKGQEFWVEGIIDEDLPYLASKGNMAAHNAITIEKYTLKDVPFYYGKIRDENGIRLGYILSLHDMGTRPKTAFVMPKY